MHRKQEPYSLSIFTKNWVDMQPTMRHIVHAAIYLLGADHDAMCGQHQGLPLETNKMERRQHERIWLNGEQ
jgi:hypothetical protein